MLPGPTLSDLTMTEVDLQPPASTRSYDGLSDRVLQRLNRHRRLKPVRRLSGKPGPKEGTDTDRPRTTSAGGPTQTQASTNTDRPRTTSTGGHYPANRVRTLTCRERQVQEVRPGEQEDDTRKPITAGVGLRGPTTAPANESYKGSTGMSSYVRTLTVTKTASTGRRTDRTKYCVLLTITNPTTTGKTPEAEAGRYGTARKRAGKPQTPLPGGI
jgi:hypothetical protein